MRIIKQKEKLEKFAIFCCNKCGTEFECEIDECERSLKLYIFSNIFVTDFYKYDCPICKNTCIVEYADFMTRPPNNK